MRIYPADQIADFFLARSNPEFGDLISNLKLQKLCYYAAGLIAAVRQDDGRPLFADPIEAWQHGPVVPSQYRRFAQYGADNIPAADGFDFSRLDANDLSVLDDVYNFYGQYSAWKLRNMTHEERPWLDAYQRASKSISTGELREFFANDVSPEYVESYRAQAT